MSEKGQNPESFLKKPELLSQATEFSRLREQSGLSIKNLSSRLGLSASTLRRWESGETRPRQAAIDLLKSLVANKLLGEKQPAFRFIDLFAGIGGMRRAFDAISGECVFTSEWEKYSLQTYKANYDCNHAMAGDITKVRAEDIPEHDLLLAGFPCQPFSIAGVSKKKSLNQPHGFRCNAQGTLFFDVARITAYSKH